MAEATAPVAGAVAKRPGIFARHYERSFHDAIQKLAAGDSQAALAAFVEADESDDKHRVISPAMFAGFQTAQLGDHAAAIPYLERVAASEVQLPDALMNKYAGSVESSLRVDEQISIPMEIGSAAASFVLAQCYCDTGRLDEAIGIMQQLYEHAQSPAMLMALCNLYLRAEAWDEIVHVTAGMSNEDDVTLKVRLQQAEAMEHQGLPDAALEAYRDALKSKRRSPDLLKQARYRRAKLYINSGKRGMAKRDLGRLYGEDPDYQDVAVLLRELAALRA